MGVIVLEAISCHVDMEQLLEKMQMKKNSGHLDRLQTLLDQGLRIARPKALYKKVRITGKTKDGVLIGDILLTSRILQENTAENQWLFPYLATCGRELEEWGNAQKDVFDQYTAGVIQEMACRTAMDTVLEQIDEPYGLINPSTINPGSLNDWPLEQQQPLFELLENAQHRIGMELTESCLMRPMKSVSGIRFSGKEQHYNCQCCPREDCIGRVMPYRDQKGNR
ncbi:MAG: vitamin B12 dependent-methionine synthase activation domain-containing protein [Bacillota bacterium]|nr:vitamin B12 dependent-methionine synthase activation domain-containing protein [Bacillota bacterium]MDW7678260.1 vitamin B12 dependent-methionine synthase activation domain-containing protein [Bacillota bacterium]